MHLLGIDIGGTKTAACVGTEAGKILASARMSSGGFARFDDYVAALSDLCRGVIDTAGVRLADIPAVGISAPGPLSVARGVLLDPPNNPGWHDVPIVSLVEKMLDPDHPNRRPVFMNNDANAGALAEYLFGAHKGTSELLYLTFSTGMGGGIISGGRLVQGVNDMGGEVGHHTVEINGLACPCGRRGCWEMYVGGRNVALRLQERIRREKIRTAILDKAGGVIENISMEHLDAAAAEGDAFAAAEWDQLTERLAQGVGTLIMVLNPKVIVMGTIAVKTGERSLGPLRAKLPKYTWKWPLEAVTISASTLDERIGDYAALAVAVTGMKQA